jgi:hypothetical protein
VVNTWDIRSSEYFNTMTLHGMMTLEAGDTAEAQRLFEQVLRESRGGRFVDRPIAERYATLLTKYQKR